MASILIVETDSSDRRIAAMFLRAEHHHVIESSECEEGLKIASAEAPDLVIIDAVMTKMDGGQFVQALYADAAGNHPAVIFRAPACIENEARAVASAYGVFFVVKQASVGVLFSTVDIALAERPPLAVVSLEPMLADGLWRQLASRLYRSVERLEKINGDLSRDMAKCNSQLEAARTAVDREIKKRLWAEQELTRLNTGLRDQAMRDVLTGLHNRRYMEESLYLEESRARRGNLTFGIMMIDIDHFKRVNDTFGHAAGDEVLRVFGNHLRSLARTGDIVSRYGGEEFVLLMTESSKSTVLERAEEIRQGAQLLEFEHEGKRIGGITLSLGVGIFPDHGDSGHAVLRSADIALYKAKLAGRNCTMIGGIDTPTLGGGEFDLPANVPEKTTFDVLP
ncbi:MAG TPA: diguanylate cyclase [Usitatibacteraceae bacterium]